MNVKFANVIIAIAIISSAYILASAYTYKYKSQETIVVTGLGETEFSSDLIVWECRLTVETTNVEEGYASLERDKKMVNDFISKQGVADSAVNYNFVQVNKMTESTYGANGNYTGQKFKGYQLIQPITIESKEIDLIEGLTRDISSLIAQGVMIEAFSPSYFYTKLDDLKLALIEGASADARQRAEKIAINSNAKLGALKEARMGVFQITGANSNEEYLAGGSFNTRDRNKKARVTMRVEYRVK